MKKRSNLRSVLFYIIVIIAMISISSYLLQGMTKQKELVYSDIMDMFENREVEEFVVSIVTPWHIFFFKFFPYAATACSIKVFLILTVLKFVNTNHIWHCGKCIFNMSDAVTVSFVTKEFFHPRICEQFH